MTSMAGHARHLLSNDGFVLAIDYRPQSAGLARRLVDFLQPFFGEAAADAAPDLTIDLHGLASFSPEQRARCQRPMRIRESNAPGFTLTVRVPEDDDAQAGRLAWDGQAGVGYRIRPELHWIEFYADDSGFVHLIELVRYYGLRVEQSRGSFVMHASAIMDARTGNITAVGGPKGAGKTTTMMALVAKGSHWYFSGDKLLLDIRQGHIRARGWPDFPYIGAGTLRTWPEWAARLGLKETIQDGAIPANHKFLVDPRDFKRAIPYTPTGSGVLDRVILPDVRYDGPARPTRLSEDEAHASLGMHGLFEWPSDFLIGRWHGLVPANGDGASMLTSEMAKALVDLRWERRDGVGEVHA